MARNYLQDYQSEGMINDDDKDKPWHYLKKDRPDLYKEISQTTNRTDAINVLREFGYSGSDRAIWNNFSGRFQAPGRTMPGDTFTTDWSGNPIVEEEKETTPIMKTETKEKIKGFFKRKDEGEEEEVEVNDMRGGGVITKGFRVVKKT